MSAHAGRVVTNEDLLERVWGHRGSASPAVLEKS